MLSVIDKVAPDVQVSRGDQRFTEPKVADGHGPFAISFYQEENQRVYLIQIADGQHGLRINESAISPEDRLPDSVKANLVLGILTSNQSILGVVDSCLNKGQEYEWNSALELAPKYSMTIVGPSNVGKSNLVVQISENGLPVHNLDAVNNIAYYQEQVNLGVKPPFVEQPRSGPIYDNSAYSLEVLQQQITDFVEFQNQNESPVIAESGGFSIRSEKARPMNPLTVVASASEIIMFVDRLDRGEMTYDQMLANNRGMQLFKIRDSFTYSIDGSVVDVGQASANFVKEKQAIFLHHALKLRLSFCLAFFETIKDPDLKFKLMPLIAKYGSNHDL